MGNKNSHLMVPKPETYSPAVMARMPFTNPTLCLLPRV